MIDTLAIAQSLEDAGLEKRPAEAIAKAIRNGQEERVTQYFARRGTSSFRVEAGKFRPETSDSIGSLQGAMDELRDELTKQCDSLMRRIKALAFAVAAHILVQFVILFQQI